jgi:hypothetical protein
MSLLLAVSLTLPSKVGAMLGMGGAYTLVAGGFARASRMDPFKEVT